MRRNRRRKKESIETSKKLLLFAIVLAVAITIFSCVAVIVTRDTSPLVYLIPAVFGLLATAYGFYFWKAKAENLQKYGGKDPTKLYDDGSGNLDYPTYTYDDETRG